MWADFLHWTPYGRVVFCMSELWKKCSHVSEQQEQGKLVAESGDSTGWAVAWVSRAGKWRQQLGLRSFLEIRTWTQGQSWGQAQLWHSLGWARRPGLEFRWNCWAMGSRWEESQPQTANAQATSAVSPAASTGACFQWGSASLGVSTINPWIFLYLFQRTLNKIISHGCHFWSMMFLKNAYLRKGCLAKNEHRHLLQQMLLSFCPVCSLWRSIRHMVFAKEVYYFDKILPTFSYTMIESDSEFT